MFYSKIADNQNTWNIFSRKTAFWFVVFWLSAFVTEGFSIIFLFHNSDSFSYMVVAGGLDCLLSMACLVLFLKAEMDRCCNCDTTTSNRFLASEKDSYPSCDPYHDCCPRFGTRLCGGVGQLEPITAIIALRLLRFTLGNKLWKCCYKIKSRLYDRKSSLDFSHGSREEVSDRSIEAIDNTLMDVDTRTPDVSFKHKTGTVAELWTLAISKYPHIVEEHGMYSGLLLEAMLGIAPAPKTSRHSLDEDLNTLQEHEEHAKREPGNATPSQSILRKISHDRKLSFARLSSARSSAGKSSIGENNNEDNDHNFIRPASALVRSMRRCQFKWLPLLDEWEVVDVVLTKYEIVWLGPKPLGGLWDENIDKRREEINNSLQTLKGGKGMRLCDVVVGREVFGRLPLKDIEQIKVQRRRPVFKRFASTKRRKRDLENATDVDDFDKEFWIDDKKLPQKFERDPDGRWATVMEDCLMMVSHQGTLCLRFLIDLINEESKQSNDSMPNSDQKFDTKEGAFLWCQTLSHLCGSKQLKQKLPNFGKDRDSELIDFIEVIETQKRGIMTSFPSMASLRL